MCHNCIFLGEKFNLWSLGLGAIKKFNFWSPDLPRLHFFGGKVKFLKYGRATIDNCIFGGESSIPESRLAIMAFFRAKSWILVVWMCHNCIFLGESSISEVRTCHNFTFWWEKLNFWSMDVPQLIIAFFWGGKVQFLKLDLGTTAFFFGTTACFFGKSSIPEFWTWGQLHFLGERGKVQFLKSGLATIAIFFGEKLNFWSMHVPQLIIAFFGGIIQFLSSGLATIDNCIFAWFNFNFFWGRSWISDFWTFPKFGQCLRFRAYVIFFWSQVVLFNSKPDGGQVGEEYSSSSLAFYGIPIFAFLLVETCGNSDLFETEILITTKLKSRSYWFKFLLRTYLDLILVLFLRHCIFAPNSWLGLIRAYSNLISRKPGEPLLRHY